MLSTMDAIVLIAMGAAIAILVASGKKSHVSGMQDTPVSLENIRRGVANGWYTAVLTKVDGQYAIRLSGRTNNGKLYTDVYPISEQDYNILLSEGYTEV